MKFRNLAFFLALGISLTTFSQERHTVSKNKLKNVQREVVSKKTEARNETIEVGENDLYVVEKGVTHIGKVKLKKGARLQIKGKLILTDLQISSQGATISINKGAVLKTDEEFLTDALFNDYTRVVNYGYLSIYTWDFHGDLENHGMAVFKGGYLVVSEGSSITNHGTIKVGSAWFDVGSSFNNYAHFNTASALVLNGETNNYGTIKTVEEDGHIYFDDQGTHVLHERSRIVTKSLTADDIIQGPKDGGYAHIKVHHETKITKVGVVLGNINLCAFNTENCERKGYIAPTVQECQ